MLTTRTCLLALAWCYNFTEIYISFCLGTVVGGSQLTTISLRLNDGTVVVRFETVSAFLTPGAMTQLHERFNALWQTEEVEPLLLIHTYILDFLFGTAMVAWLA